MSSSLDSVVAYQYKRYGLLGDRVLISAINAAKQLLVLSQNRYRGGWTLPPPLTHNKSDSIANESRPLAELIHQSVILDRGISAAHQQKQIPTNPVEIVQGRADLLIYIAFLPLLYGQDLYCHQVTKTTSDSTFTGRAKPTKLTRTYRYNYTIKMRPSITLFILYSAATAVIASPQNGASTARRCCYSDKTEMLSLSRYCCDEKALFWNEKRGVCLFTSIYQASDVLACCLDHSRLKGVFLCENPSRSQRGLLSRS